ITPPDNAPDDRHLHENLASAAALGLRNGWRRIGWTCRRGGIRDGPQAMGRQRRARNLVRRHLELAQLAVHDRSLHLQPHYTRRAVVWAVGAGREKTASARTLHPGRGARVRLGSFREY